MATASVAGGYRGLGIPSASFPPSTIGTTVGSENGIYPVLSDFAVCLSYTLAVRGLLGGGSVMVRRMRAFVVAAAALTSSSADMLYLLVAAFTWSGLSRHHQGRTMVMFRG